MVQGDNFNKLSLIGHFSVFVKFYNNCVRVGLLNMNVINVHGDKVKIISNHIPAGRFRHVSNEYKDSFALF